MLVARTDWDAPKHRGLTYFAMPMRQPGVEVRPLRQMNEHSSFNEVFMTDARIPRDYVVGNVGDGWTVALTTLAYERRFGGMGRPQFSNGSGRALDEARGEAAEHFATYAWYPQRAGRVDLVVDRAACVGSGRRCRRAPGDRPVAVHATSERLDGRPGASRSGTGPAARGRGVASASSP